MVYKALYKGARHQSVEELNVDAVLEASVIPHRLVRFA